MKKEDLNKEFDLLKGNLDRIMTTNDLDELDLSLIFVYRRINRIYEERRKNFYRIEE